MAFSKNDFIWSDTEKDKFINLLKKEIEFIDDKEEKSIIRQAKNFYFSLERSILLGPGEQVELGSYAFIFNGHEEIRGPNYIGDRANINVLRNGSEIETLYPERRIYLASGTPSTEMAIDAGLLRDLFVTLGEEKEGGSWSMTVYVKPFVRWIWLGAIFMAIGGTIAALDKRYRLLRRRKIEKSKEREVVADLAATQ